MTAELVVLAYDGQERVWQHVVWVQSVLSFQAALSLFGLAFTGPRFRVAARVLIVAAFLSLLLFNPIKGFEPTVPEGADLLWSAFVFAPSLLAIASAGLALRDGAAGWARALLLIVAAVLFVGNASLVPGWVEAAN